MTTEEDPKRSPFKCQSCGKPWARSMTYEDHERCQEDIAALPCLNCGAVFRFHLDSKEAERIFNVFCNGECEDRYAAKL